MPGRSDPRVDFALAPFFDALCDAKNRIWVLDLHAFDAALPVLYEAMFMTSAVHIRILSKKPDKVPMLCVPVEASDTREAETMSLPDAVKVMRDARREGVPTQRKAAVVEWQLFGSSESIIHDRFALVDDDLWHWGASVGGLHRSIHAVSHGWRDAADAFAVLFNALWKDGGKTI